MSAAVSAPDDRTGAAGSDWVFSNVAAKLVGLQPEHLAQMARKGVVSVRRIPGVRTQYRLSELRELIEKSTSTAEQR